MFLCITVDNAVTFWGRLFNSSGNTYIYVSSYNNNDVYPKNRIIAMTSEMWREGSMMVRTPIFLRISEVSDNFSPR